MTSGSGPRVLVIGLAESTLDLILPWVESGILPTFRQLMNEGVYGRLESRVPYITPQMWGTIYTGVPAGQHGAFDFWQRGENGRFHEVNGSDLKQKTLWDFLGNAGIKCGIVNMPFTYPPQHVNGYMIAGEDAPGAHRSIASPPELYDELVENFGRYRLKDIFPGGRDKSDYLTLIEEDINQQTRVLEHLLTRHPTNLFLAMYSATAISQHYFWSDMESEEANNPYRSVIESAYRNLDASIGQLMKAVGTDTQVYVISECGAGPLQSGVNINAWLAQEGFLVYSRNARNSGSGSAGGNNIANVAAATRKNLHRALQKHLPSSMYYLTNRYLASAKTLMQSFVVNHGIDWNRTRAFSRGKEGNIYISLEGRDPQGIVTRREYDRLCEDIADRLQALVDPATGKPAVTNVYRSDELYQGPSQRVAPDLTIEWREGLYCPHESKRDDDSVFVTRWREYMNWPTSGGHRSDGIFFAHGPGIRKGQRIGGASILDIAPTLLHAFRQPVPGNLEGRVLEDIFEATG